MGGSGAVGVGVPAGLPRTLAARAGLGTLLACAALLLPNRGNEKPVEPMVPISVSESIPVRLGRGLQPWSRGGRRNLIMAPTPGMACAAV